MNYAIIRGIKDIPLFSNLSREASPVNLERGGRLQAPNETVEKQRFQFVFLFLSSIFSDFGLVSVLFIQMWKRIVPANPAQGQG